MFRYAESRPRTRRMKRIPVPVPQISFLRPINDRIARSEQALISSWLRVDSLWLGESAKSDIRAERQLGRTVPRIPRLSRLNSRQIHFSGFFALSRGYPLFVDSLSTSEFITINPPFARGRTVAEWKHSYRSIGPPNCSASPRP